MTIETTTSESGGVDSNGFTPAEAAFFASRGEKTEGLTLDDVSDAPQQPQGGVPDPAATQGALDQQQAPGDLSDEDIDAMGGEDVQMGADGKPRNKNGQFVSHQAFHAVREKYKTTRDTLAATQQQMARADERLQVLNQILMAGAQQEPARQVEQPVDPATDPLGALNQALAHIKRLEDQVKERDNQTAQRDAHAQMKSIFLQDAQAYGQQNPDFKDAIAHLVDGRRKELEAVGVTDVGQREQMIDREVQQLVANALQNRQSPAAMMHKLALARGFVKAAPQPTPQQQPTLQQQLGVDPAQRIQQIAQGQRIAGASLANSGGSSGEGLTAAALADMDEAQFAEVTAKLGKAKLRQLMGG